MHPWRQSVSSWPWAVSLSKGDLNSFLHGWNHPSSSAFTDLVPLVLSFQLTQYSSGMHPPCNWEFNSHLRTIPLVHQPHGFASIPTAKPIQTEAICIRPPSLAFLWCKWTVIYSTTQEGTSLREKPPKSLEGLWVCVCLGVGWSGGQKGDTVLGKHVGWLSDQWLFLVDFKTLSHLSIPLQTPPAHIAVEWAIHEQ